MWNRYNSIYSETMNPILSQMSPFMVMDVLERANALQRQGADVIHLEVGEPDFEMPRCALEAMQRAMADGLTHYTHSLGDLDLREAIAAFYASEHGVEVDPECIVVTSGSSPALLMAVMLLCGAGDELLMSNPGYACYRNFALACNAVPAEVTLCAETGFDYDMDELRRAVGSRTRALIINSPMNPTGTLLGPSTMQALAGLPVPVISDEIYHGLVYGGKAHTMLEYTDNCFVVNGFSKRFAMTGLRLGWMVVPRRHVRSVRTLQQNLFICAPSLSQRAGLAALQGASADVERMRAVYDERRRFLIGRLRQLGFVIHTEPEGAFYIFADARRLTDDVYRFAFEVLEQAHVGITPGIDFGTNGSGFVRFSYANSLGNISEATNRIEAFLRTRGR